MAKIFISHSTKGIKCRKLASDFEAFLHDVLGLRNEEVFLSSRNDCITAGASPYPEILKGMREAEVIIFLITREFTKSVPCVAEIGAAWALGSGSKLLIPLLESSVNFSYINNSPLMGIEGKRYEEKSDLEYIGRIFYEKGIISRSPDEFRDDLDSFCAETGWGGHGVSILDLYAAQPEDLNNYIKELRTQSDKSDEACYLLSCALDCDVLTEIGIKEKEDSKELLADAARNCYPWADLKIADMIFHGDFPYKTDRSTRAFKYVSAAAKSETECPPAWINLGWMLCLGLGCQRDLEEAEKLCNRVPEGLSEKKCNLLAVLSRIQDNKKVDIPSTDEYNGDAQLMFQAGEMYLLGGVDFLPDFHKALNCYTLSAENGSVEAEARLGDLYYYGLVDSDPTSECCPDLNPDYKMSAQHFQKAADAGNVHAQTMLGSMYRRGLGVDNDWNEAIKLLDPAAGCDYAPAQYELGLLLGRRGYLQGYKKAQHLFLSAADQGHAEAQCLMGDAYRFELLNCERDMHEAVKLYKKAAKQGNIVAELRLRELDLK